jgi:hypothetical protein
MDEETVFTIEAEGLPVHVRYRQPSLFTRLEDPTANSQENATSL